MKHFNESELENQLKIYLTARLDECNRVINAEQERLKAPKLTSVNQAYAERTIECISHIADYLKFEISLHTKGKPFVLDTLITL